MKRFPAQKKPAPRGNAAVRVQYSSNKHLINSTKQHRIERASFSCFARRPHKVGQRVIFKFLAGIARSRFWSSAVRLLAFRPCDLRGAPRALVRWRQRVNRHIDFATINRAAISALPAILNRMLPGGRVVGHEYVARNPRSADKRPGSFKINLKNGKWADFATGDRGGDPVSLIAYVENIRQGEAAGLLSRMLGLSTEVRHG